MEQTERICECQFSYPATDSELDMSFDLNHTLASCRGSNLLPDFRLFAVLLCNYDASSAHPSRCGDFFI